MRPASSDLARRVAFEFKTVVARHPAIALPIARRRHGVPVDGRARIVIEGFPRTGTSFAVAAFEMAQPASVRIACHVHAPAQVLGGIRLGLPVLLVVREPEETVLSFVVRNPHLSLRQAFRGYVRFYAPLLPIRDRLVVASFDEVTTDLGAVIRRVNERFGTAFREFVHTTENVRACFAAIDSDYHRRVTGEEFARSVARPVEARERMKDELRAASRAPGLGPLRARAEDAYRLLAGGARAC